MIQTVVHILSNGRKVGDGSIEFKDVEEALDFEATFNEAMSSYRLHIFPLSESSHVYDEEDMCPNCVTPWKCNGPHILDGIPVDIS
jgi:hypothetical protein